VSSGIVVVTCPLGAAPLRYRGRRRGVGPGLLGPGEAGGLGELHGAGERKAVRDPGCLLELLDTVLEYGAASLPQLPASPCPCRLLIAGTGSTSTNSRDSPTFLAAVGSHSKQR